MPMRNVSKGAYILFVTLRNAVTVNVGRLGGLTFKEGEYCYAGSAMNGLDQRIKRHFSKNKKIHWHIDRLTVIADGTEAFVSFAHSECALARMAEECGCEPSFRGFGSSDCGCRTHLFRVDAATKKELLKRSAATPFRPEREL